jgi:predicted nucleic acid-binding Zn ribbon protein
MRERRATPPTPSAARGPPAPAERGEALHGILRRALHQHGFARRLPRRISPEAWEHAVGRQIAARAQPTVLAGGTLHLLVEDHRWRDQLDAARVFLLERINGRLGAGAVRELQFGLAHAGVLEVARRRAGIGEGQRAEKEAVAPPLVLGEARLEPLLREALLRAAEAAQRAGAARAEA